MNAYKTRAWFMVEKEAIKYKSIREYIEKKSLKRDKIL